MNSAAIELARANLPEMIANPRTSEVVKGEVPDWMYDPQEFPRHGYWVRIWRSEVIELVPFYRRMAAIVEYTKLDEEEVRPLGLYWTYSVHSEGRWKGYYELHGHFDGHNKRLCEDLVELYRSITYEIRYVIERLAGRDELQRRRNERRDRRNGRD